MARTPRDQIEPRVLVIIAIALITAAFLSYDGHPVENSNLYAPHAPAWLFVATFVLMGILARLFYIYDRRRTTKGKDNAPPKT
jgi:hypothetical protein